MIISSIKYEPKTTCFLKAMDGSLYTPHRIKSKACNRNRTLKMIFIPQECGDGAEATSAPL